MSGSRIFRRRWPRGAEGRSPGAERGQRRRKIAERGQPRRKIRLELTSGGPEPTESGGEPESSGGELFRRAERGVERTELFNLRCDPRSR